MNIMPDVVDAQLRFQFLGRDVMLPGVMASDPAHDPNALPVEALKKPLFSAFTTQHSEPYKSSESTSSESETLSRTSDRDFRRVCYLNLKTGLLYIVYNRDSPAGERKLDL